MDLRRTVTAALAGSALIIALAAAEATLRPGQILPDFVATDLTHRKHSSRELRGSPTLLVVLTERRGGSAARAWIERAAVRYPGVKSRALLALELPPFISSEELRRRVQSLTPRNYWDETWYDRTGAVRRRLGLPRSNQPYVFVLDEHGRVIAVGHGDPNQQGAAPVWAALAGR